MNSTTAYAILGVRLCALFFLLLGLWLLVANLIEGASDFNPSYLGYFLLTQVVRPALAMLLGLVLWVLSKPMGRLLAHGLS